MRLTPLGLVAVLLVPSAQARASTCAVEAPVLDADLARACATVLAAVPGWDGRGRVRLGDGDAAVAAETVGSVVTLHRSGWARLTPAGRQEVLTHELVHVATAGVDAPLWLQEGLAESVALQDGAIPDGVAGAELAAAPLPSRLPTEADFAKDPAVAYQASWLAVDLLRQEHGDVWVLRLYGGSERPDADLVQRLRSEIERRLP